MLERASSPSYAPLPVDHDHEKGEEILSLPLRRRNTRWPIAFLAFSLLINALLLFAVIGERKKQASMVPWRGDRPTYSPIRDSIRYENRVFPYLTDTSKYHGPPTDEVDANWDELYKFGISAIPTSEMVKLANQSDPIHGHPGRHFIQLDVFHHLHCLNNIRKFVWPKRYPNVVEQRLATVNGVFFDHIDHCVNALREALMCNPDFTPDVWRTDPDDGRSKVKFNMVHTCVNWDSVRDWALKNQSPYDFDDQTKTSGNLVSATDHAATGHEGHHHGMP